MKFLNQLEFSSLLFDTIFGLILFYSFDSLIGIGSMLIMAFYLFSMLILIHWWLIFKSTDDSFNEEVTDSAADIVFGIVYAVVLYYLVQSSRATDFRTATAFMLGLFVLDFVWSAIWRYVGSWRTNDKDRIRNMEGILNKSLALDFLFAACFAVLFVVQRQLPDLAFILAYVGFYVAYITLTFKTKTLNIDIF